MDAFFEKYSISQGTQKAIGNLNCLMPIKKLNP